MSGLVIALAMVLVSPAHAWSFRDRTAPTAPGNFRVTAVTPFSVSLAWSPSKDNSGKFSYRLWSSAGMGGGGISYSVPKTATSYHWTLLIHPATTYTFRLYAVDAAGNKSAEVSVVATTLPDTLAPTTAPQITVEHINSTYVALRWTASTDNGPYLHYEVWLDGVFHTSTGIERSITLEPLEPLTTYTIAVRARDFGNNFSPFSAPVTITTAAPGSVDTTPPTEPGNLQATIVSCGTVQLTWTQSTDDFDDPALIRYDILVDGNLDHSVVGTGTTTAQTQSNWLTVFDVYAVDTSGNQSRVATVDVVMDCP
jgi:hypothetical protein